MNSVYDIAVHLGDFINVDLFRQGCYFIRVIVYSETQNAKGVGVKQFAMPYRLVLPKSSQCDSGLLKPRQREQMPARIESTESFCSRVIRVQYQDQIVRLNEVCVFRIDLCPQENPLLEIQIDLMFHEFHVDEWRKGAPLPDGETFESLEATILKFRDPRENTHAYVPVTFDNNHFCLQKCFVHMTCVNFKFLPSPTVKDANGVQIHKPTLQQSLFPENDSQPPSDLQWEHCEDHYMYYLQNGIKSHRILREKINHYYLEHVRPDDYGELMSLMSSDIPVAQLKFRDGMLTDNHPPLEQLSHRNTRKFLKPLRHRFDDPMTVSGRKVIETIQNDFIELARQVHEIWHNLLTLLPYTSQSLFLELSLDWEKGLVDRWGLSIFRETCKVSDRDNRHDLRRDEHERISAAIRTQNEKLSHITGPNLCLKKLLDSSRTHCVLFEQTFNLLDDTMRIGGPVGSSKKPTKLSIPPPQQGVVKSRTACHGKHLFVFVHGYQGNSWDMRLFKNHLSITYPSAMFMLSKSNEDKTDGDIAEMGERLADEIIEFIESNCSVDPRKISFICHSLGGIIVRQALTQECFQEYTNRLYSFISLAVCHCGYLFGRSKLVASGLFFLKKWNKSVCLSQLTLTDNEDPRQSFMYNLSLEPGLEYFENVLLISSPEDRYTPYHSARIEKHNTTGKWAPIYDELVDNLLRRITHVNFTRFDVSFASDKTSVDSVIGRAAHIFFLDRPLYIGMLLSVFKHYFVPAEDLEPS